MTDKDFGKFDPIVPERDERIGRSKPDIPRQSTKPRNSIPDSPRPKGGGGVLWKVLVLILMLGLGGLGYFFVQQTEHLDQLQGRFDDLEAKIVSTDESLNQSGTSLGIKLQSHDEVLNKHWAEIKKLWGISYDRNRKNIEAQKKVVDAQAKSLKGLQASRAARKKEVASLIGQQDKSKKSLEAVVNASLAAKLEMNDLVNQSQGAADKVNRFEKNLETLKQNLNARVAENEEAINAIDAYRLQLNRTVQQLQQQVNTLSGKSPQTP
jgi:chromosome segregation ATPase